MSENTTVMWSGSGNTGETQCGREVNTTYRYIFGTVSWTDKGCVILKNVRWALLNYYEQNVQFRSPVWVFCQCKSCSQYFWLSVVVGRLQFLCQMRACMLLVNGLNLQKPDVSFPSGVLSYVFTVRQFSVVLNFHPSDLEITADGLDKL